MPSVDEPALGQVGAQLKANVIERFGVHFVASPRHADMLLVTGPVYAPHGQGCECHCGFEKYFTDVKCREV